MSFGMASKLMNATAVVAVALDRQSSGQVNWLVVLPLLLLVLGASPASAATFYMSTR